MIGLRARGFRADPRLLLLALALQGCGPALPTALEPESPGPGIRLELDTLNLEVQALWVRIAAVPIMRGGAPAAAAASSARGRMTITWELEAETSNPRWRPAAISRVGGRSFEPSDTARVWGNVPRAYDFTLAVSVRTGSGGFVADTLAVAAPPCRGFAGSMLLCNPGGRGRGDLRGR